MFGDAKHVIDFGKSEFGMDTVRWVALMAIHGAVHFPANLGVKYTWVGPGYLSNVYYKMIANKPMYRNDRGGDLSFGQVHTILFIENYSILPSFIRTASGSAKILASAKGDPNGNPVPIFGW